MRVICIDDSRCPELGSSRLNEGQIYNVREALAENGQMLACEGVHPYIITVKGQKHRIVGSKKYRFIPLSEIDEKNLAHAEPIESTLILKEV